MNFQSADPTLPLDSLPTLGHKRTAHSEQDCDDDFEVDYFINKDDEQALAKYEEYQLLRAEYPRRKGKQPKEFYVRLTKLKRKYLTKREEEVKEEEKVSSMMAQMESTNRCCEVMTQTVDHEDDDQDPKS